MTPPTDPSECIGTPEHDELRAAARKIAQGILDLEAEERMSDQQQYPYRFSH